MLTPQVRPQIRAGKAPRGRLTYVAILAILAAVVLFLMAVVRPLLHTGAPPGGALPAAGAERGTAQGGAATGAS